MRPVAALGAAQEHLSGGHKASRSTSGTPGSQSPTSAPHVLGVGLAFLPDMQISVSSSDQTALFPSPPLLSQAFLSGGSCVAGTKAFSQTSTVIEGNQKDSSLSRGGGDDVLNFRRLWPGVYIASPVRGRGKSKAFPGKADRTPSRPGGYSWGSGRDSGKQRLSQTASSPARPADEAKAEWAVLDQGRACGGLPS